MRTARIWMVVGSVAVTFAASTARADDGGPTEDSGAEDAAFADDAPPDDAGVLETGGGADAGVDGESPDGGVADAAELLSDASLDGAAADAAHASDAAVAAVSPTPLDLPSEGCSATGRPPVAHASDALLALALVLTRRKRSSRRRVDGGGS